MASSLSHVQMWLTWKEIKISLKNNKIIMFYVSKLTPRSKPEQNLHMNFFFFFTFLDLKTIEKPRKRKRIQQIWRNKYGETYTLMTIPSNLY